MNDEHARRSQQAVWFCLICVLVGLVLVAVGADNARSVGILGALATTAFGGALGFLFGIPRPSSGAAEPTPQEASAGGAGGARRGVRPIGTLEQVVDWLTKFILGAGLTQLSEIKRLLLRFSDALSVCVSSPAGQPGLGRVFGLGVIGFFGTVGFVGGYLATRLVLTKLFTKEDLDRERMEREAEERGRKAGQQETLEQIQGDMNAELRKKAPVAAGTQRQEAEDALLRLKEPAVPVTDPEDPHKGRFGGRPAQNGKLLWGEVKPLNDRNSEFFDVVLFVEATEGPPLETPVRFFLHPSFSPDSEVVFPAQGVARLELRAWGAFTVGVVTDDGRTCLELDLAQDVPGAPEKFCSR